MPRPVTHGADVRTQDVQRLARIIRRVLDDDAMSKARKDKIVSLINETISLLTGGAASSVGKQRNGARA